MARSSIPTLLPLDRYAAIMGANRYHFNNLDDGNYPDACHPWWSQPGHDTLALELANAETMLRDSLGYDVAPAWRVETIAFDVPQRKGVPWELTTPKTPQGYVQAFGRRTAVLIEADVTVSFSGDVGSLSVTGVGGYGADEIRVYYRTTDGADAAADEGWRIHPLTVTIASGTATLRGHKAQFALPSVLADTAQPHDAADSAKYVTAVDVYRVYTDPSLPLTFLWDALWAGTASPEASASQQGVARLLNSRLGRFEARPATWSGTAHTLAAPAYGVPPGNIQIGYRAGHPLGSNLLIDPQLEEAVVRLANVLMPCPPNHLCDAAATKWHRDRAQPEPLTNEIVRNPFGISEGALFALRVVLQRRITTGGKL